MMIGRTYPGHGNVRLKRNAGKYNQASKHFPFLLLTDLDQVECPPQLVREWIPSPVHPNFLFCVAVREVESWLLADRSGLAAFLRISVKMIPEDVEGLPDPKQFLINLARHSKRRDIREEVVPRPNSTAKIGPAYNHRMREFVQHYWNLSDAYRLSPSLARMVDKVRLFQPLKVT